MLVLEVVEPLFGDPLEEVGDYGGVLKQSWDLSSFRLLSLLPGCHGLGGVPLPHPLAMIYYCTIWPQA